MLCSHSHLCEGLRKAPARIAISSSLLITGLFRWWVTSLRRDPGPCDVVTGNLGDTPTLRAHEDGTALAQFRLDLLASLRGSSLWFLARGKNFISPEEFIGKTHPLPTAKILRCTADGDAFWGCPIYVIDTKPYNCVDEGKALSVHGVLIGRPGARAPLLTVPAFTHSSIAEPGTIMMAMTATAGHQSAVRGCQQSFRSPRRSNAGRVQCESPLQLQCRLMPANRVADGPISSSQSWPLVLCRLVHSASASVLQPERAPAVQFAGLQPSAWSIGWLDIRWWHLSAIQPSAHDKALRASGIAVSRGTSLGSAAGRLNSTCHQHGMTHAWTARCGRRRAEDPVMGRRRSGA